MPSILNDGANFLPNVLRNQDFQRKGYLYAEEPGGPLGLHWAVIDPRKQILNVWRKNIPNFLDAAKVEPANIITHGPYFKYATRNPYRGMVNVGFRMYWAGIKNFAHAALGAHNPAWVSGHMGALPLQLRQTYDQAIIDNYSSPGPVGHIYSGNHSNTTFSDKNNYYFGRKAPGNFSDYEIGNGESPRIAEVIGGLRLILEDYSVVPETAISNQYDVYGLAPLDAASEAWIEADASSQLRAALRELQTADEQVQNNWGALHGVIVVVFQLAQQTEIAQMLARALVKDAVHLDPSDSVLLGIEGDIKIGNDMGDNKLIGSNYGFKFISRS